MVQKGPDGPKMGPKWYGKVWVQKKFSTDI